MKRALIFTITAIIGLSGCFLVAGTPEAAFHDFQTNEHKESYMVLPLCIAGEKVVPLVINRIKDKDLNRRRYAIGFLGTSNSREPVPILEEIVRDESELVYFRGDAIESIFVLDEEMGRKLASEYQDRTDFLGAVAVEITRVKDQAAYRMKYREQVCSPDD